MTGWVWKLEFQKRDGTHYYIIVRLPKVYKHEYLKHWLSNSWYEVAQRFWDEKQENHLSAGTEVQKIKNFRSAAQCLCNYLNKELEDEPKHQGRYWGCSRNWCDLMHEAELKGRQTLRNDSEIRTA